MERIRHIKETQKPELLDAQTETNEAGPHRAAIEQTTEYNFASETSPDQVRVREFIESIDEQLLFELFSEYFRKSGSEQATINWIPLDKVRILNQTDFEQQVSAPAGGAYAKARGVELNSEKLTTEANILWTLIHEQCHAISEKALEFELPTDDPESGEIKSDTGLYKYKFVKDGVNEIETSRHENINEGVTELLTERIFREYLRRSGHNVFGDRPEDAGEDWKQRQIEETVAHMKFSPYERYWQNARFYIELVSALADVPRNIVEDGMIRAYTRNGTLVLDDAIIDTLREQHERLPALLLLMADSTKETGDLVDILQWEFKNHDYSIEMKRQLMKALVDSNKEWSDAADLILGKESSN